MPDTISPVITSRAGRGSEAAGYIPSIPDPVGEVQKALGLYTANIPNLITGAGQINEANQQQLVKQISDLYPQFQGNVRQMGADIGNWAAGNISDSTKNALAQAMAERGGTLGMGPNAASTNAALMAVLGKTAEGLQAQAVTAQNSLLSGLPKAALVDPTKLGPSPNELLQTISQGDLTAALINASPDPEEAYRRALKNAKDALAAGKISATGPFAGGSPTTGGGLSADLLANLIARGTGQGPLVVTGSGVDTGYRAPGSYSGPPTVYGNTWGNVGTSDFDGVPAGDPSSHTAAGWTDQDWADYWYDLTGEDLTGGDTGDSWLTTDSGPDYSGEDYDYYP